VRTYISPFLVIALILSTSVQSFEPMRADSTTLTVPDDFLTIQEAINNAAEGDAVFVDRLNKTYGGTSEDELWALVQTVDGGYALAGCTVSLGAGNWDAWLVKTDGNGNTLWNKTYGGTDGDGARSLVQTGDGGYVLTGSTVSFSVGLSDFWLVKTDANGNAQWNKTYGGTNWDDVYSVVQTGDGGYALAGCTDSFGAGNGDFWLVKTDASGNTQWNKTYGGTSEDRAYSVVQTVDGGYALAGYTYSFGAGDSDVWLVKTSANGDVPWNQTYGGTGEDYARSMVQTSDGGCALAGTTASFGAGNIDFWLLKTARQTSTIIVPDEYSTIQEAVNHAFDGDTVYVKTGTYYEHVVVNKTVSLVGENRDTTIIDGNRTGCVLDIVSDSVNVTSFTVQRSGNTMFPDFDAGISLNNAKSCIISNNNITDNGCFGIHLLNSNQNTISENDLTRNAMYAIDLTTSHNNTVSSNAAIFNTNIAIGMHIASENNNIIGNRVISNPCGIDAANVSNNTISHNYLTDNSEIGIWVQDNSINNGIYGNNVTGSRYCIKIEEQADSNTVSGNILTGGQFGIYILNARYTEIYNNTVAHCYGSDWDAAVRLESAGYTVIHNNEIFDNWRGILLYASSPYVSVYGNNVTSNEYGIRVAMGGSNYVNVSGNYVANNRGYGIDVTGFGGGGESNYATIARNLIVNNTFEAVGLGIGSNYNTIVQNDMIGNGHAGVTLERYSNYNTIVQNNIIENAYGICFDLYIVNSTQNVILNNNIINNTQQVRIASGSVNNWDGGYPAGGNYWSDCSGTDLFCGVYQNRSGSDGIADEPYIIDAENKDRYPLMNPWTPQALITDINDDGKVNILDVTIVAKAFGTKQGDLMWNEAADLDKNGQINIIDITIVAKDYGKSV
jgi:parallel beta-helix repeat protein